MDHKPEPLLVSASDLQYFIGLSKSKAYDLLKQGQFPNPVRVSDRRVAWRLADLKAWVEQLPIQESRLI